MKLTVHDDGIGFDPEAARHRVLKSGSMGLIGMDERAQLAGGRLKLRSAPGGGTTVSAIFPVSAVASDHPVLPAEVPAA
jgi:signal transduction histidine kinase